MHDENALGLARALWNAYKRVASQPGPVVIRRLLTAEQAEALPRSWKSSGERFRVALASGPHMVRAADPAAALEEYRREPRTRLYESVHTRGGEWPSLVASQLASWLDADVLSSVYEADVADAGLPEHRDAWHNIVLQLEGSKRWSFGQTETVLHPGDVLVVPTGVLHFVRTDNHSVHINFELVDPEVVAIALRDSIPVT